MACGAWGLRGQAGGQLALPKPSGGTAQALQLQCANFSMLGSWRCMAW